jgi:phospholipid transport system substrate-binding protein
MKMTKKILLLIAIFYTTIAFATNINNVKTNFTLTTNKIIKIIQNKKLDLQTRNDKIIEMITPMFDFKLMAKLSLGKTWKILNKQQQNEFVKLYVKRMKKSYSSKIDKYTNEKIVINDIQQIKKNRAILKTNLITQDDKLEIVYKFYKPKRQQQNKNDWLIYDVVIAGVSIVKTDKAQFKAVLKETSVEALLDKLRN